MIARLVIGHRAFTPGATDSHGNPVPDWASAVNVKVYGVQPRTEVEPDTGRALVVEGLTILAPAGVVIGPLDHVVIDGEEYEVDGDPLDYTRGPFGFAPGIAVNVKRIEG